MRNLVGTWHIAVPQSEGNPEAFEAYHTFFADSNWTEVNSVKEVNHGAWSGEGSTYRLVFEGFMFDAQGKHNGKFQVRASIEMDGADHLTASWVQDLFDLQGKVIERALFGTFEGTRLAVENAAAAPEAAL